jgi:hypothetical protein
MRHRAERRARIIIADTTSAGQTRRLLTPAESAGVNTVPAELAGQKAARQPEPHQFTEDSLTRIWSRDNRPELTDLGMVITACSIGEDTPIRRLARISVGRQG